MVLPREKSLHVIMNFSIWTRTKLKGRGFLVTTSLNGLPACTMKLSYGIFRKALRAGHVKKKN